MFKAIGRLLGIIDRKAKSLGQQGEEAAAAYLRLKGYRIVTQNFRCEFGEIDIICRDRDELVFVEVKTRKSEAPESSFENAPASSVPDPEAQVNGEKQQQLTKLAKHYLARYRDKIPAARFDVVAVICPDDHQPIIRHTTHAFEAKN